MSNSKHIMTVLANHIELHMRESTNLSAENARLRARVRDLERKAAEAQWQGWKVEPAEDQDAPVLERDQDGHQVEYDRWGTRRPVMNGHTILTHAETYEMMRTRWPAKPIKAAPADTTPPKRGGGR